MLKREYTQERTRDPEHLSRLIKDANEQWDGLDCVIEDLITRDLLCAFCDEHPNCRPRSEERRNDAHHLVFEVHAKAPLFRFVKDNALLKDLDRFVNTLQFLRWCLGLAPEGDG